MSDEPAIGRVAVYGHLGANVGLGAAGRGTIAALEAAGVGIDRFDIDRIATGELPPAGPSAPAAICLVHTNAAQLAWLLQRLGPAAVTPIFDGRHTIGYWAWETADSLPQYSWTLQQLFNELWVPSRFVARSVNWRWNGTPYRRAKGTPLRLISRCIGPAIAEP